MEVSNQPQLSLRQVGGRFGFSPPIVPPGTEPDLQALNNSFVAAANSANQRLTSSNTTSHNIPATISTDSSSQPSLPRTSSVTQSHPQFYETVSPALQSISQEARGDHHVIPVATSDDDLSRPVLSRAPSMTMASQSHPTLRLVNQETQGDRCVILSLLLTITIYHGQFSQGPPQSPWHINHTLSFMRLLILPSVQSVKKLKVIIMLFLLLPLTMSIYYDHWQFCQEPPQLSWCLKHTFSHTRL